MTFQVSPFVKYKGMEVFATYERASGKTNAETDTRTFSQMAVEGVYRFLPKEQAFIGARYNTTGGRLQGFAADISIKRTSFSAGWLPSKNLMLKAELVNQKYIDYPSSHVYSGGEFKGVMIEAVIGF
jgi:Flp pilus assembly CpaF family ATPase